MTADAISTWTIIGGIATLLALVVAVVIAFLQSRRTVIRISKLDVQRLVSEHMDDLTVTFRGQPVVDPHLVATTIKNLGPKDIPPQDFHGGAAGLTLRDAVFRATLPGTAALTTSHPEPGVTQLCLPPQLLVAGDEVQIRVLVAGRPSVEPLLRLPATRLTTRPELEPRLAVRLGVFGGVFLSMWMLWWLAGSPGSLWLPLVLGVFYGLLAYGVASIGQRVATRWSQRPSRRKEDL